MEERTVTMTLVKFSEAEIVDIETGNSFILWEGMVQMWTPHDASEPFNVCRENADKFWDWLNHTAITFDDHQAADQVISDDEMIGMILRGSYPAVAKHAAQIALKWRTERDEARRLYSIHCDS
jgi:hypothetical protein